MNNLLMYCMSLDNNHLNTIKRLNYIPVGLGKNEFSNEWLKDNSEDNISFKNPYYGEYTFHYWIWKNYLNNLNQKWIGFCQYRKFWTKKTIKQKYISFDELEESILKKIPNEYENYESILGEPFYVNKFKFSKFVKRGFKKMIFSPSLIFNESKRNIKFHFDMWHGDGNLEKAINFLDESEKSDFYGFVIKNTCFNPHNMFICKSKKILKNYYDSVFPWLERCEKDFGFDNLKGYGLKRIYGFLAERYMSYWFQKKTKYITMPIYFQDITSF